LPTRVGEAGSPLDGAVPKRYRPAVEWPSWFWLPFRGNLGSSLIPLLRPSSCVIGGTMVCNVLDTASGILAAENVQSARPHGGASRSAAVPWCGTSPRRLLRITGDVACCTLGALIADKRLTSIPGTRNRGYQRPCAGRRSPERALGHCCSGLRSSGAMPIAQDSTVAQAKVA